MCDPSLITPQLRVDDAAWQETGSASFTRSSEVTLSPQPDDEEGSWQWSGCGTSGGNREQMISPMESCEAEVSFTNSCGAESHYRFELQVEEDGASGGEQACGEGNPHATVTGSPGNYQVNGEAAGANYYEAITSAIRSLSSGRNAPERVSVMADGALGTNSISLPSNTVFEVCGTMDVAVSRGNGSVQAIGARNVSVPHMNMTGRPWFGMRFADVHGLHLGQINLRLSSGLGIRFERDLPGSTDVRMDNVFVSGTDNHGVETWNVDGLEIGTVTLRDTGYAGLLLNNTRNATIELVDGENTGTGTGYATLRFANTNGRIGNGYPTNIFVDRVISRGGGRGLFCVSNSGGAEINHIDFANNGNNAILIENCHNITVHGGTINRGGEVRLAARSEFPNNSDITIANLEVSNNSVNESPCGNNVSWFNVTVEGGDYSVCD